MRARASASARTVYADSMSRYAVTTALALITPSLSITAQEQKPPRLVRSLADGLVRQRIEIDRLRPPKISEGVELGSGQGPLVLLIRRAKGGIDFEVIERGHGNHGPSPVPKLIEEPTPKAGGKKKPQEEAEEPDAELILRVARKDGILSITKGAAEQITEGKAIDQPALKAALTRLFEARRGNKRAKQMVLDIHEEAMIQDVVTIVGVARKVGFSSLMFSGARRGSLTGDDKKRIMDLPSKYGFRVEHRGAQGGQPVADGEVLVLLDGPTRWADFSPIYAQFAKAGIWRIGLLCQRDMRTRFKMPINLPFDAGL